MTETTSGETRDLLAALAERRHFLTHTADNLSDDQARLTPTVSELSIAGLIKHVTTVESRWVGFILDGPDAMARDTVATEDVPAEDITKFQQGFVVRPEETLAGLLEAYQQTAARTEATIRGLESLDRSQPLPKAPWFEPGARWSARRVITQLIGETAQHAGHADIIRETIDGQKSMG